MCFSDILLGRAIQKIELGTGMPQILVKQFDSWSRARLRRAKLFLVCVSYKTSYCFNLSLCAINLTLKLSHISSFFLFFLLLFLVVIIVVVVIHVVVVDPTNLPLKFG